MAEETELETQTDDQTQDDGEQEQHDQPSATLEDVATKLGWAPQDEWRGDPGDWVDAETFIYQGRDILKKTLSRQDGELAEVKSTLKEFKDYLQGVDERAYKQAKADLERQRREAVAEGDVEEVDRIQGQIDELPAPTKAEQGQQANGQAQNPDTDPHFLAFQAQNKWYGDDYRMTAYADQIAPIVGRKGFTGEAFYSEIARAVKEEFADKSHNSRRDRRAAVEGASNTSRKKGGEKGYEDLPPEAKAQCDKFVAQGLLDRAKYVANYKWD